jgi:iron complex outermembrane receptor protein
VNQTGSTPKDHFHTQELRIRSNNDSPFQWQTGAMYYNNTLQDENEVRFYPSSALLARSKTAKDTTAVGVFAETNWALTSATRLTAGARYDHTKVATEQDYTSQLLITKRLAGDEGIREFDNVTYKLRLEHDLTPANMIYALVATGFSPGDVAVTTNAALQPEVVRLDAETLTSYEVGSKNRFMDDRLQVNGAVFYYDYGAYQVANINLTPGSPNRTFATIPVPVTTYGAELEVLARPWKHGELSVTAAYTNAKYHDIPAQYAYLFGFDEIPGVPPYEASVSYNHSLPLAAGINLRLGGSVRLTSAHDVGRVADTQLQYGREYVHVRNETTVDLNASLAFANGKYSLTGYVRNLTDIRYKTYGDGGISGTLVESAASANTVSSTAALNDPRTWGMMLTGRF